MGPQLVLQLEPKEEMALRRVLLVCGLPGPHPLCIHTGQSHLAVVGVVGDSWTS